VSVCTDCGGAWDYGPGEREWFEENRVRFPRRCKPCRERRRAARAAEERLAGSIALVREEWGFIQSDAGQQFYFRRTDVSNGAALSAGERVTFCAGDRATGPRPRATLVQRGEAHG
jgi:hypothetical protein